MSTTSRRPEASASAYIGSPTIRNAATLPVIGAAIPMSYCGFTNFNSLMRMLQGRHGNALGRYVSQQGVRLIEIDGCPIDFRFHMHKNGNNEWVPVGIGAKKAGRGSVTTHIKNGGSLLTPEQALSRTFGERADEMLVKAKEVSIKLSEAIERNFPHTLGELGLDIGIDKDGDIWMFEANAKPGRSIFSHPALRSQGRESLSHILEHCMYLSRFKGGTINGIRPPCGHG